MRFVAFPVTEYDEVLSGYQLGRMVEQLWLVPWGRGQIWSSKCWFFYRSTIWPGWQPERTSSYSDIQLPELHKLTLFSAIHIKMTHLIFIWDVEPQAGTAYLDRFFVIFLTCSRWMPTLQFQRDQIPPNLMSMIFHISHSILHNFHKWQIHCHRITQIINQSWLSLFKIHFVKTIV